MQCTIYYFIGNNPERDLAHNTISYKTPLSISTARLELLIEKYKGCKNRPSTVNNYLNTWRRFNKFLMKLDKKPKFWEDRAMLFAASLIDQGIQSSTLKSYISAIKGLLIDDGYNWDDSKMLIRTLSRACRLTNDRITVQLPIKLGLLEIILFELKRLFHDRRYLALLYQTLFSVAYYGLFRVGELATGSHPIRAKDVHIQQNKNKLLFVLYTSKTHGHESRPQKIKIRANPEFSKYKSNKFFCPFQLSREYLKLRGGYSSEDESFFVFRDQSPVTPHQVNTILRKILKSINLDSKVYSFHSIRIGRASEMIKAGYTIDEVKLAGRWKSNAVFRYIREF